MSPHEYIADEYKEVDDIDSNTDNTDVVQYIDEDVC